MSLRKSDLMVAELNEFLDTLPQVPCKESPTSRYFCTVCERLNKSVQKNCKLYNSHIDNVGLSDHPYRDVWGGEDKVKQLPGERESVEFKIVGDDEPGGADSDMPLFEIVKANIDNSEPLEMRLLEDEAIEFDLMNDDDVPISVDAIEVEPVDDDEEFDGIEVEPMEVEEIDDGVTAAPQLPAATKKKTARPKGKKRSVKRKTTKGPVSVKKTAATARPKAVMRPKPAGTPRIKPVATVKPKPVAAVRPQVAAEVTPPDELIKDIEEQLILGSPCTQCGGTLNNPKFCTQCGAQVIVSADGVKTVPRQ